MKSKFFAAVLLAVVCGVAEAKPYVFSLSCKVTGLNRELGTAEGRGRLMDWARANHISKVWLESFRHGEKVETARLIEARDDFRAAGFEACGMITPTRLNEVEEGQDAARMVVCWSDEKAVGRLLEEVRRAAKIFDVVIIDDFLFSECWEKCAACEKERKERGIADIAMFHREQMYAISKRIIAAAKEVNEKAQFIIKYPCWAAAYAENGYQPLAQARLFGACWVGTEAREGQADAMAGCRLMDAMDYLTGGRCLGGWFDALDTSSEKFIEQARYTILGGAKEMLIHCYDYLLGEEPGATPFGEKADRAATCAAAFEKESAALFCLATLLQGAERLGCEWMYDADGKFLNVSRHRFRKDGEEFCVYQNNSEKEFVRGAVRVAAHGVSGLIKEEVPRCISGVYPDLAMRNAEGECGTGAVVPWAGSLWAVTYGPHCPVGSSDKLYQITSNLQQIVRLESVGGTPADRLMHRESGKLLIGPYLISGEGEVETIPIVKMPGRLTGAARHLTDTNKIYVTTMEEALYEVDVSGKSAAVKTLVRDDHNKETYDWFYEEARVAYPEGWNEAEGSQLFGYHGKGTCSGFGKVFYANNGEDSEAAREDARTPSGALAWWAPGVKDWQLIRTNQFTEVTTRDGIYGNEHPQKNPIWALGWDHRSVILTMTADGETWQDYRLPKASHSYDGAHGWNTEWPRIREIGEGEELLATMHGTFWRFPATFAPGSAAGIRPRSTYLKVIGDFCRWGERVVFGCDDHARSEFLNVRDLKGKRAKARASESNLWFVEPGKLDELGPREGKGAVWSGDTVRKGEASAPFLFAGYEQKWVWLTLAAEVQVDVKGDGKWQAVGTLPRGGHDLGKVPRGEWVRLVAKEASTNAFAVFHYTSRGRGESAAVFEEVAPKESAAIFEDDAAVPEGLIGADEASLIYVDKGVRRRLPRRTVGSAATCGRLCREVSTERDLLHVGEIFYELPAENTGGFRYVHPVAATARQICDYDTWKGCLVLKEADGVMRIGVADDLWGLGRPVGVGGPWKGTAVKAGEASDAYLMNGFGRKTLEVAADRDVTMVLEADIDGNGTWVKAGEYAAGKVPRKIALPDGFSAYWVRMRADCDCTATAWFVYE